jgi:hypothetical protein
MNNRLRTLGMLILGTMFLACCSCSRAPARVYPPGIDAAAAGPAAMQEYDVNKDGKVAGPELAAAPGLSAAIANLDKDGDKAVSAEEVTKRIESWQKSKVGLTSVVVTVRYLGRPLAGANVVFEPEAFLGPNIKNSSGTTGETGMAVLSIPNADRQGVPFGLYKVRITKEDMNLPAKCNTQTILGAEVAPDAKNAETGPVFDLK